MRLYTFVFAVFCVFAGLAEIPNSYSALQSFSDVRIPVFQTLTQYDFDKLVVGASLKEAYILLPNPPPFAVSKNYNCRVTATKGNYQRVCTGIDPICEMCVEYSFPLTLEADGNRISFSYTDPNGQTVYDYYWSPYPSKYILRLQCPSNSLRKNNKCARTGTRITVFLLGYVNQSNAPWKDIAKEIFRATGVESGMVVGMNWYYTENTGTPCNICSG
ncbi:uncharacterized protein LOC132754741 [Ruditapes philippinarum]|uniref:uncharacterized protein LOC132754741 n=1 Tax=Ruditapes philippinarum TaxID=129788 RepID=UPI00295B56C4|nr:uncharacterized protein LOC132754741 [Ruditapes philippinarum]